MSRDDLQDVLAAIVPFAKEKLETLGACPPVAASLDTAGEMDLHFPSPGASGETETLIETLKQELRDGAAEGRYVAVGIGMEVEAQRMDDPEPVDAIMVHLEAKGEALAFFQPYAQRPDGSVAWGETFFGPADVELFEAT